MTMLAKNSLNGEDALLFLKIDVPCITKFSFLSSNFDVRSRSAVNAFIILIPP
jgi:hypothetical protein